MIMYKYLLETSHHCKKTTIATTATNTIVAVEDEADVTVEAMPPAPENIAGPMVVATTMDLLANQKPTATRTRLPSRTRWEDPPRTVATDGVGW